MINSAMPPTVRVPPTGGIRTKGTILTKEFDIGDGSECIYVEKVNGKLLGVFSLSTHEHNDHAMHRERYDMYLASRGELQSYETGHRDIEPLCELGIADTRTTIVMDMRLSEKEKRAAIAEGIAKVAWQHLCCVEIIDRQQALEHESERERNEPALVRD